MNQYKIGDTVWTRKRGKCRVIREVSSPANRPYRIMDQNGCFYYPKASNLYPSEAAMKQATQDEFIRANPILCGWNKAFTCECHKVVYLGKVNQHDTFLVTTKEGGTKALFRGTKGDDI